VCVCSLRPESATISVSLRSHISETTRSNFRTSHQIFIHVDCGRGSACGPLADSSSHTGNAPFLRSTRLCRVRLPCCRLFPALARVRVCCSISEQDGIFFTCFTDIIDARVANRAQALSLQVSQVFSMTCLVHRVPRRYHLFNRARQ